MAVFKKPDEIGEVKVVGRGYKPKGPFHRIEMATPIRRGDGRLCGVTKPRDMTYIHSYGGEAPFFEGIAEGRLLATRCDNPDCDFKGTVYEPFRIHCMDCLEPCTVIDLTDVANRTATIHSFIITERTGAFNTLDVPIRFVNVEFEGVATILMSVLLAGEPQIGMRVVPVFRTKEPRYDITDLAFVPEGTPDKKLPKGFTFAKK
jgi:uncharacterized OB-fold protein